MPTEQQVAEPQETEDSVLEEEWTNADGENVFEIETPFQKLRLTKMEGLFRNNSTNQSLVFESHSMKQMTPLDMTYDDTTDVNEFYDGTGSLVWLASIAFCHLVAEGKIPQLRLNQKVEKEQTRICELGCGCGLAGIATLLSSLSSSSVDNTPLVVFTDNDSEALELCESNCELNNISPKLYQHELLSWGDLPKQNNDDYLLKEESFQVVLATDVVYDICMIPPLLQSASALLLPGGHIILSHVPRFFLPRDENDTRQTNPQQDLEQHIIEQMNLVGLQLAETIRPYQVLTRIPKENNQEDDDFQISLKRLQEAHAVLFVAVKQ